MVRPATGRLGAAGVLLGTALSLVGFTWDIQWHVDVGPDTFFTLSHLMVYAGSAIAGIASLSMVLLATFASKAGRPIDEIAGGRPVRVFRTFTAPLGYLISGIGSAMFLLYGLVDLWWHSIYGFDAVLDSPPHIALFTSVTVTMLGLIIVFGNALDSRWGQIGLLISIPMLMTWTPLTANVFGVIPLPFDGTLAAMITFLVVLLMFGRAVFGRPGAAVAIAVVLGAMQAALWWFAPWSAKAYASFVGLPLRDALGNRPPELPSHIPMFMIGVALAVEGVLILGGRRGWSVRWMPQIAGAVGGLILVESFLVQFTLVNGDPAPGASTVLLGGILGLLFGALGGFLAWRLAGILKEGYRIEPGLTVPANRPLIVREGLS
ncbi:MAG TPA: hypothetical protein VGP57_15405 [Actinoplanes sp.]|nr:hypothetical protein [Actinoplanes sp.]